MGREWLQMIEAKLDREIGDAVGDWLKQGMFRLCWTGPDIWTVRFGVEDVPTNHSAQFESFRELLLEFLDQNSPNDYDRYLWPDQWTPYYPLTGPEFDDDPENTRAVRCVQDMLRVFEAAYPVAGHAPPAGREPDLFDRQ